MNYIISKNISYFLNIGEYNFCDLSQMELPDVLAIDSETTGLFALHEEMFCLQIGTGKNNYIIDFYTSENAYKLTDVVPYIKDKTLIFHNALFDLGFCYKYGFYPDNIKDTMLATKVLYNGDVTNLQADFKTVMERELNVLYDKTDQKNIHIIKLSQSSTIEYSFNDVDRLIELHEALEKKIIAKKSLLTYELHCNYIKALAYMEQCGLPISPEKWKNKMIEDQKNSITYGKKIEEYIFDNLFKFRDRQLDMFDDTKRILVSINSPIQMVEIFNSLGINTKDKDGKNSINEKVISKSKHEFVSLWLKYQEANHRVTTFGQKILDKIINNRIYSNFNPMVDTARISTRKGHINFLNFPSDEITRDCFVANKGNIIVVADYSAQEAVLLADKTKDEAMMASVLEGAD
jgi:DNA polymerase I-like protein with 3'-5' exonuclease and polymerase domains